MYLMYVIFVCMFFSVPPDKPFIIDDRGKEIQELAGPYEEGSEMTLKCVVTGGNINDLEPNICV